MLEKHDQTRTLRNMKAPSVTPEAGSGSGEEVKTEPLNTAMDTSELVSEEPKFEKGNTIPLKDGSMLRIEHVSKRYVVAVIDSSGKTREYVVDGLQISDAEKGLLNFDTWELMNDSRVELLGAGTVVLFNGFMCDIRFVDSEGKLVLVEQGTGKNYVVTKEKVVPLFNKDGSPITVTETKIEEGVSVDENELS
jgi:hypothetical protein